MSLCPNISYKFVGVIRQSVLQISIIHKILMGYWVDGQVINIMSSVMCRSKFRMGDTILRRVLMISQEMLLSTLEEYQ